MITRRSLVDLLAAGLATAAAAGCLRTTEYACVKAEACGAGAACVDGACALPVDVSECPSGFRFGDGAGPRAGTCTPAPPPVDAAVDARIDAPVDARPPLPAYGRGVDGPAVITPAPAERSVNTCAPLTPAAAGATDLAYDRARTIVATVPGVGDFAADRLVMIWQTTGLGPTVAPVGSQAPLVLADVGRYQLVRVVAATPGHLELAEPLAFAVTAGAQVCRVPEFTTVTIAAANVDGVLSDGTVRPSPWSGATGGVVAMFASEGVTIGGVGSGITASGRGFRGGQGTSGAAAANCTMLSGPSSTGGGAHRGEGLVPAWFSIGAGPAESFGIGNGTVGGGGGGCASAGGGGGAGAGGAGGRGGFQAAAQATGNGLGGAAAVLDPRTHLLLGGGGGGGDGSHNQPGSGGAGGGAVWLAAASVTCTGGNGVRANATGGGDSSSGGAIGDDGGGGGGGGGTLYLEVGSIERCELQAVGQAGGDTRADPANPALRRGPGGGGGGGRILARVATTATAVSYNVGAGAAGVVTPSTMTSGAEAGRAGARCGDSVVAPGEACDDGNLVRGDGCDQCVPE